MAQINTDIKLPSDKNARIWRYVDFAKFMSMLDRKALFFSNIKDFDDSYEGVLPRVIKKKYKKEIINGQKKMDEKLHHSISSKRLSEIDHREFLKSLKRRHNIALVNSWHMNEYESAFMWDVYSSRNKGIAIQSTCKRLDEALKIDNNYENIKIGIVEYKDYLKDTNISLKNIFFTKRKSFEHESELRALMMLNYTQVYTSGKLVKRKDYQTHKIIFHKEKAMGRNASVDLKKLIEKIYASPLSKHGIRI